MASDGPFGDAPDMSVGFSDAAILVVSLLGFLFLATTIYSLILMRVQSKEEFEKAQDEQLDYDEQLEKADVSTLNRAQRRQRAQLIMKRQRRIASNSTTPHEEEDEEHEEEHHAQLSRKERQKAAKAAEREERRLFEGQRRELQRDAQEAAKREKKKRERLEAERLERKRQERLEAKEAQEEAEYREWNTFLALENGEEIMTVQEFVEHAREKKVVSIDSLAEQFQRPSDQVCKRIQELVDSSRLTGVVDKDRFIYITPEEMAAVAKSILDRKEVSLCDLAKSTGSLIKL